MKANPRTAFVWTAVVMVLSIPATALLVLEPAFAQQGGGGGAVAPEAMTWAFIGAAAATGLSSLAAGYAVAIVGSAAVGAVTEKPELLGRMLVLVGLAEGIAIYGLIVSILILNQTGA